MSPEQFQRLEAMYDAVAALSPGERTQYIELHCAGDDDLRRELLAAFRNEGSGLTGLVEHAAAAIAEGGNWAGRRMGPYRVVRPLGHGGMGTVYLAVRDDDQFHKEVAIKTLKFETGDSFQLTRFRHERQILASLTHPHIAQLLDGGTTAQGTPYIVMEHVAGVPINTYCEERRLSIEDRLRLFRQVCDAVQHAHRNLIVHRDIKPGNILVTTGGVPKLLDFGIAKLLDPGAVTGEAPPATATGLMLMTPDYASPEQVRGEPITTATDIYSLGAVLYQLLTGERPHPLQNYDAAEITRVICQTQIRPPSSFGARRLRGDLDNIVLKAMQKEPARRYSSVEQFSEDIRRHLDGLPVSARPDTKVYRARKFVRRHRLAVAAAVAVLAALSAGVAVSLHEARIAQRRFAQVREVANTFLFQLYDEVTPLPGSTAVRASIVEISRRYLDGLVQEAGGDKDLILELAQAYQRLGYVQGRTGTANLGNLDGARRSYQNALALYARLPVTGSSPSGQRRKVAEVLLALGRIEYNAYREEAAEPLTRRMLDLLGDAKPDAQTLMLRALGERSLGEIRLKQGHTTEALALMESAHQTLLGLRTSGYADRNLAVEISSTEERLARTKVQAGDLDGALKDFQELVRNSEPCNPQGPPGSACRALGVRLSWTGDVYAAESRPSLGEPEKAAVLYQQALDIQERIAAADSQDRQARFDLAARCGKLGDAVWRSDPKRAMALYERALATAHALVSKEQLDILRDAYLEAICRPLIHLGRTAEARRALTELLKNSDNSTAYADVLGDLWVRTQWAHLLAAESKHEEASQALETLIQRAEKLRATHTSDLAPVYLISKCYRDLADLSSGQERREALLHSAAAWHTWPATSFSRREEEKDLAAAKP